MDTSPQTQATAAVSAPNLGMTHQRLALATILLYSVPMAGIGFMDLLTAMYLMKFSTDVLAVSPAAMGVIFFVSRICGAVSDPLAGFLSDRTRTRMGRRRPWLLATALPIGAVFALMWSPPAELSPTALTLWMGVMVVLFTILTNIYLMPHDALGAELSDDYHDRNRIFGTKRMVFGVGALAVFTTALMLYMALVIRERPDYRGRGAVHPVKALSDIWHNQHARLLLLVFFVQQLGIGTVTIMGAYHTQYLLGVPQALPLVLGTFFVVSILSVPIWIAFGRRFEKKPLLVTSMVMVCIGIGGMFFVGPGGVVAMALLAAIGGAAAGGADVVFPSLCADVIDYDEYRTGERKEGMYFAAWNFVAKTALGLAAIVTGFALSASGFDPNREQTETAKLAIRSLMSGYPLVCYGTGALLFLRFGLTRQAHAEIRAATPKQSLPKDPTEHSREGFVCLGRSADGELRRLDVAAPDVDRGAGRIDDRLVHGVVEPAVAVTKLDREATGCLHVAVNRLAVGMLAGTHADRCAARACVVVAAHDVVECLHLDHHVL